MFKRVTTTFRMPSASSMATILASSLVAYNVVFGVATAGALCTAITGPINSLSGDLKLAITTIAVLATTFAGYQVVFGELKGWAHKLAEIGLGIGIVTGAAGLFAVQSC